MGTCVKLSDLVQHPLAVANVTVREVLTNERNLFDICTGLLSIHVSREVANVRSHLNNEDDRCIWMANANGKFSLASA